ncbi:hypothetical protein TRFO_02998 [Tritrichomonas foetus]|uniref:DUF3447 domain-containing protein n=1 Tax=Tritrichomonas foetus TaxID=1144522 RepID=A0A1J4KUC2_9EUKA|nr:hypothetical protein TRFO_02998 [Tritrichomonas foetus]|eukprot:OHT14738.1 hypothetical protein TRFO_02998 [Tritrichomonas foetus]
MFSDQYYNFENYNSLSSLNSFNSFNSLSTLGSSEEIDDQVLIESRREEALEGLLLHLDGDNIFYAMNCILESPWFDDLDMMEKLAHKVFEAARIRPMNVELYLRLCKEWTESVPEFERCISKICLQMPRDNMFFAYKWISSRPELMKKVLTSYVSDEAMIWFAPELEEHNPSGFERKLLGMSSRAADEPLIRAFINLINNEEEYVESYGQNFTSNISIVSNIKANNYLGSFNNCNQSVNDEIKDINTSCCNDYNLCSVNGLCGREIKNVNEIESVSESQNDVNDKWKLYKEQRELGINPSPAAIALRFDDLEWLQVLAARDNIDVNQRIDVSIFERCNVVNHRPTWIQFAAFFGSVKCFKFLLVNGANLKLFDEHPVSDGNFSNSCTNLLHFAIAGGDNEIIRICYNTFNNLDGCDDVAGHFKHYAIYDWIKMMTSCAECDYSE